MTRAARPRVAGRRAGDPGGLGGLVADARSPGRRPRGTARIACAEVRRENASGSASAAASTRSTRCSAQGARSTTSSSRTDTTSRSTTKRRFAAAEASVRAVAAAVGARGRDRPHEPAPPPALQGCRLGTDPRRRPGRARSRLRGRAGRDRDLVRLYARERQRLGLELGHRSRLVVVAAQGHALRRANSLVTTRCGRWSHHPLVRDHIRVCWENRAATGNCGECEKCVRTMVYVELLGRGREPLGRSPGPARWWSGVDRVPFVHPQQVSSYEPMLRDLRGPRPRRRDANASSNARYDPFEDRAQRVREREEERARRARERQARRATG